MLTTLSAVKSRLAVTDTVFDDLLTSAIAAISARFDSETNRTLARTENFTQEFDPDDTEIIATCYPIESVSKFETKTSEASGWQEITAPDFLIRNSCIISLSSPFIIHPSSFILCRVIYTAGYLLPGDPDPQPSPNNPQPSRLPADLEQAAVEQVAYWFQTRDTLGLKTTWPHGGEYRQFAQLPLLLPVQAALAHYKRWSL